MKVVGIDLIKLFRNFKFEKSAVILTGYMEIAGYFLGNFDIEKNCVPLKIAFMPDIVVYAG